MVNIRLAHCSEFADIWPVIQLVLMSGDTYVFPPDIPKDWMRSYWMGEGVLTFVATLEHQIVGTFILKPNQPGRGAHVANAAFMVHPDYQGQGIGKAMGEYALAAAKDAGFKAMQFNMVVSTNEKAVRLWQKLGFQIVGRLPKVFAHQQLGLVDAYVMHRFLE